VVEVQGPSIETFTGEEGQGIINVLFGKVANEG